MLSTAIGVVVIGMMTRYLGTEGFGAYSTATAYLQIFALLLDLGLNVTFIALLGEHAGDEAYEKRCTSALFTLRVVMALLILGVLAPLVSLTLPYPPLLKLTILALTGSFIFPAMNQVVIGVQQKHLKMSATAVAENVGRLATFIGLVLIEWFHLGLVPLMLLLSVAAFANFLTNFLSTRAYGFFDWNWDPAFWAMALKRSWPVGISIAFNLVYYKADTLVLQYFRPLSEVGIYGATYRVLEILITVPFMYAGVLLPVLASVWAQKDHKRMEHLLTHSLEAMYLIIAPLVAGTFVLATRLMTVVAGPDFAASGPVLRVLILAVGVIYLNTVLSHAIVAMNAQKRMIPMYIFVAISTLAAYILFIPRYGMWAAAWFTVYSEAVILIGSWVVTRHRARFSLPWKPALAATAASFVMAGAVYLTRNLFLAIPFLVALAVYPISLFVLGGISKETIKDVLSIGKRPNLETPTL